MFLQPIAKFMVNNTILYSLCVTANRVIYVRGKSDWLINIKIMQANLPGLLFLNLFVYIYMYTHTHTHTHTHVFIYLYSVSHIYFYTF